MVNRKKKPGSETGYTGDSDPAVPSTSTTGGEQSQSQLTVTNLITDDISALSEENQLMVNTILKAVQRMLDAKDKHINQLETKVTTLESRIDELENQLDEVDQYERRDTVIISGPSLPLETNSENATDIVVNTIKDTLKLQISPSEINVAHRLSSKSKPMQKKPMIVKLQSRQTKDNIMSACIRLKPTLYVNESLTPKRLDILKVIWNIRKEHKEQFKQCYTRDGKIYVKLQCSELKHIITNDKSLQIFLDKFPALRVGAS